MEKQIDNEIKFKLQSGEGYIDLQDMREKIEKARKNKRRYSNNLERREKKDI